MSKYWEYFAYLLRHKWFVAVECFKHGLYWRGLVHDLSKIRLDELIPYANFFLRATPRDPAGYYKPTNTGDVAFDFAWFLHQKRNRHHWQFWVLPDDEGKIKVLDMPLADRQEMLCDWAGARKAQRIKTNVAYWYQKHKAKIQLSVTTRQWIETAIQEWDI